MPLFNDMSVDYTSGGTAAHRGVLRRLNPMVFLTTGCILFILIIVAALIVFTFLPIFTSAKGNQTKYQVESAAFTLVYNLPDRLTISSMNWTYAVDELEPDKLFLLQNLLQDQLKIKKITRKTSIAVMDAYITRHDTSTTNVLIVSPITLDHNNKTVIVITQPDSSTNVNTTTQLIVTVMLRYAFECTQKCQNNLKESIFEQTFHSLELPVDIFQVLFINQLESSINTYLSSSSSSTTQPTTLPLCVITSPSSSLTSTIITAMKYEAESSLNKFISTTIQSCSVCSDKQKVGNIGFTNELIFRQIQSQYGGLTTLIFYYTTDRRRSAELIVNDRLPSINITFPTMPPNQDIALLPITLTLCQGFNSIRIYNPYDYTPEFDRIVVF